MQVQQKSNAGKNKVAIFVAIGIAAVVIGLAAWQNPSTNMFSHKVTDTVKIVSINNKGYSGCVAETSDHYYVKLPSCDGQPGDSILATYDANLKQSRNVFQP